MGKVNEMHTRRDSVPLESGVSGEQYVCMDSLWYNKLVQVKGEW